MRESFRRVEDGEDIYIEVDLSAYGYSQKYSWLFSVFIKFDATNENQTGFEEFLEAKESLIIALEHDEKAKYVGSRVIDGWSEFYFYANSSKTLDSLVAKMLQPSNYIYESNVVKDSKWDFHYKNLLPTELEMAYIQSGKIVEMLKEEGDDLSKKRDVEHYLSFKTPTQKEKFIANLRDDFVYKDDVSSDEFENGIAIVKRHSVLEDEVKVIIKDLFDDVKKEQGFYEGWSTTLADEN